MLEKLTERARKVLTFSRQQAQRLNSEFIGTEHMLLGILDEGGGVAAKMLKKLDVDTRLLRAEVEKLLVPMTSLAADRTLIPVSPRAKEVLDVAYEEAVKAQESAVGTEHVLCALLVVEDSIAWQAMKRLGLEVDRLRAVAAEIKSSPDDPWLAGHGQGLSRRTTEDQILFVNCRNCGIVYRAEAILMDPQELKDLWKQKSGESVRGRMCRVCSCPDYRSLPITV